MAENGQGVSLADYERFVRRQWWIVLLVVCAALVVAFGYLRVAPKTYQSTASVLVLPVDVDSSGNTITNTAGKSTVNVDTEAQLVVSAAVVAEAIRHMDGVHDPRATMKNVEVTAPVNTSILQVAYRAATPADAQQGAQAFSDAYLAVRLSQAESSITASIRALQEQAAGLSSQLKTASEQAAATRTNDRVRSFAQARQSLLSSQLSTLQSRMTSLQLASTNPGTVIRKAGLPTGPVAPVRVLVLAAALAIGLLLGLGLGLVRHLLDDRVRSVDDIERRAGLEVLSSVPSRARRAAPGPVGGGTVGRAYRQLHNVLVPKLVTDDHKGCVLLITRASAGSSSEVVAQLGVATARAGTLVAVVAADLQSSTLHDLLELPRQPGLVEVLRGDRELADVLLGDREFSGASETPGEDTPRSDLLAVTAGDGGPECYDLLESTRMRTVVDELRRSTEALFIEGPSTAAGADAQTLGIQADHVILVVERKVTTLKHLQEAQRQFNATGTAVLGVVLLPRASRQGPLRRLRRGRRQPVARTYRSAASRGGVAKAPLQVAGANLSTDAVEEGRPGRSRRWGPRGSSSGRQSVDAPH